MVKQNKIEVWLRGPMENIPALIQPVAHALLQAKEEVHELVIDFPESYLWHRPAGVASVGFHLQHLTGVLDRLFTYAKGGELDGDQLKALSLEGKVSEGKDSLTTLFQMFEQQVEKSIQDLTVINEQTLTEQRFVGRAKIPSNVIGLLFHAAEHTMRHVGQLLVSVKVIRGSLTTGL